MSHFSAGCSGQLYFYSWLSYQTQQICTVQVLQDAMIPSDRTAKTTAYHTTSPIILEGIKATRCQTRRGKVLDPEICLMLIHGYCCSCTGGWESVCTSMAHSHVDFSHRNSAPCQACQRQSQQQKQYLPLCCPAQQQLGMQTGGGRRREGPRGSPVRCGLWPTTQYITAGETESSGCVTHKL